MPDVTPPPRTAGPIFAVSALGFVPVVGLVFGLIGVCWGLMSERPRAIRAAVVGALAMVFNLGACVALGMWAIREQSGDVSFGTHMARQEMIAVVEALERYHGRHARYPDSLVALRNETFKLTDNELYDTGISIFELRRYYRYRPAADRQGYRLFSAGPDGRPGTADDIHPVLPDSLLGRTGLEGQPTPAADAEIERKKAAIERGKALE